jgi:ABC-type glycerol-3-phosphate transport system substrate-binding protein
MYPDHNFKKEKLMKKFGILFLIALFVFSLVGCAPAKAPTPEEVVVEEAPEEAVVEEVEVAEEETAAEPEPVTIAFWYPYGEGSWTGDFLAAKITQFNEENPGITVVGQSFEDYGSIVEGLQRSAAAEDLPGIACIAYGFDEYIVGSGLATPVTDYFTGEDPNFMDDFFPSLIEATTIDGEVYGIPLALSVAEVFYHSDLFEQAGLDPANPPQTWEEFLQAAETIHNELGIYGATFALDDMWIFETAVRSNGGELISDDGTTALLDSQVAIDTLSDWAAGVQDGSILYNADFYETLQTFGAQQVAMFAVSSYGTLIYRDIAPLVMAMPWPAAEGHVIKSPAGGNSLYIFGNSDAERAAAAKFIIYLTNPEANAEWAMNSGYLPTRYSSLEAMSDFIEGFENYKIAVDGINNVVPATQFPGENDPLIRQYIMDAIEAALLGASDADTALMDANAKINDLIGQ